MRYSHFSLDSGPIAQASFAVQEEPLVSAAQAGCASAFTELCNQHSQRIYRTAFAITKNREDAGTTGGPECPRDPASWLRLEEAAY